MPAGKYVSIFLLNDTSFQKIVLFLILIVDNAILCGYDLLFLPRSFANLLVQWYNYQTHRSTSTSSLVGSRHGAQDHENISWTVFLVEQGVSCPLHRGTHHRLINAHPRRLLQDFLPSSRLNQTHLLCAQVFIWLCKIAVFCCWCQPTSLCAPLPAALKQK